MCKVEIEVKGSVLDTMEHMDKQYTESMRKLLRMGALAVRFASTNKVFGHR